MTTEERVVILEQMFSDFSDSSLGLGGLEFYGRSTEYRDLIQLCRDFASDRADLLIGQSKAYVFLEKYHGKSTIAKATEVEAKLNGLTVRCLDGCLGATQRELLSLQDGHDAFVIVDGLPESATSRRTVIDRFNSLNARGMLFSPPDYVADVNLDVSIPRIRLDHLDGRPIDKLAWLIGLIREKLRDAGIVGESLAGTLAQLPVRALVTLTNAAFGPRVEEMAILADRISESLRLHCALESGGPMSAEELAAIFVEFFSPKIAQSVIGFRLWVEGDSDCRICKLASRLVKEHHGIDLEEGLQTLPLGEGREGGTSKALGVVVVENTRKNKDVFLLDCDEPGRQTAEELRSLGQEVILLDLRLSCSRTDSSVEIEDFLNLSCLDRFYESNPALRPEKEVIKYKPPVSRQLVVNGPDKEAFIVWLESNASLGDLENALFVLCEIRARFSLRIHVDANELNAWKRKLLDELNPDKQFGRRPKHWFAP